MTNILVAYYSTYGHVYALAQAVAEGARRVPETEVRIARVAELIPEEVIVGNESMLQGRAMQRDVPVATLDDLEWADGVAFGSPTRYGNMASQMKNYIDQAGPLWARGVMEGKPGTCFTSTSTMHGGQESTIITMWIPLIHLGMLVLGVPYSVGELFTTERGGGQYGASTVAGPTGGNTPNETERTIARAQGQRLAEFAKKLRG